MISEITTLSAITVWSREELIEAFMPIWQKIYLQEPEGILFRLPVDAVALGVPVSDCIAQLIVAKLYYNINISKRLNCQPTAGNQFRCYWSLQGAAK